MNIAPSSDEKQGIISFVTRCLKGRGYGMKRFGVVSKTAVDRVDSSAELAEAVAEGRCNQEVPFCRTGTGSDIAVNKISGIRAALYIVSEKAHEAMGWNNANVPVMSTKPTSNRRAKEILDAWFQERVGSGAYDKRNMKKLTDIERGI